MMRIDRVMAVRVVGACCCEDAAALRSTPLPVSERYAAAPVTSGFRHVRQVAEGVSVGLVLDDPSASHGSAHWMAWGDCVSVAHSGQAGRDLVFRAEEGLATVRRVVAPVLQGRELTGFRELAAEVERLREPVEVERRLPPPQGITRRELLTAPARLWRAAKGEERGPEDVPTERVTVQRRLHTAVRYGVSQALLGAVALARGVTKAEVIAQEWDLPCPDAPVPIHAQCGADWHAGADGMIVRRVASLSHALVGDVAEQLGPDGINLTRYARWLRQRIQELGGPGHHPTIHLDMHGALGHMVENDLGRVLGQLYALELAVRPYPLRVESPVLMDGRAAQIEAMKTLRDYLRVRKMDVQLVAGEWINTLDDVQAFVDAGAADVIHVRMPDMGGVHNAVEAVLACQAAGVGVLLGCSCAGTDLSTRVAAHVALATRPDLIVAGPGMGIGEGIGLVHNEMARTLAWIQARRG